MMHRVAHPLHMARSMLGRKDGDDEMQAGLGNWRNDAFVVVCAALNSTPTSRSKEWLWLCRGGIGIGTCQAPVKAMGFFETAFRDKKA